MLVTLLNVVIPSVTVVLIKASLILLVLLPPPLVVHQAQAVLLHLLQVVVVVLLHLGSATIILTPLIVTHLEINSVVTDQFQLVNLLLTANNVLVPT